MPFVYEAACDRCDFKSEAVWPMWSCYQWPTGNTLEIAQCWVWCATCRSVRIGEALPEVEQIRRLQAMPVIADAYDGEAKVWATAEREAACVYARYPRLTNLNEYLSHRRRWDAAVSVVMFNTLRLHGDWRLARTSAARCLTCGDTSITALATSRSGEPEANARPDCGGIVTFRKTRKVRARRHLWTVEGIWIGLG